VGDGGKPGFDSTDKVKHTGRCCRQASIFCNNCREALTLHLRPPTVSGCVVPFY